MHQLAVVDPNKFGVVDEALHILQVLRDHESGAIGFVDARIAAAGFYVQDFGMTNEVALPRGGDFQLAMKVAVFNHLDSKVLADSVSTRFEVHSVHGLEEIVKSLSANGVDGVVLISGVKDHVEFSIVKAVDEVKTRFEGHSNVHKHDVRSAISDGIVTDSGIRSLVNHTDKRAVPFNLTVQYLTGGRFIINDDGIELGIHWRTIWL